MGILTPYIFTGIYDYACLTFLDADSKKGGFLLGVTAHLNYSLIRSTQQWYTGGVRRKAGIKKEQPVSQEAGVPRQEDEFKDVRSQP